MNNKKGYIIVFTLLLLYLLTACSGDKTDREMPKPKDIKNNGSRGTGNGEKNDETNTDKDAIIEFQDPLVERCIRETLNKGMNDTITDKECASIKELIIDCEKENGLIWNTSMLQFQKSCYVDLSDLKYCTGLISLTINNNPTFDMLVDVDAISNCNKLQKLSLNHDPIVENGFWNMECTYKDYERIIQQLPDLKELNIGYSIPDEMKNWIRGSNTGLKIIASEGVATKSRSLIFFDDAYDISKLSGIPQDITDLILICEEGDTVDFNEIKKFKNLRTLTVYSTVMLSASGIVTDNMCSIRNIEALSNNSNLYSLCLCGVTGDFKGISELRGLKELSILGSKVNDTSFLLNTNSGLRELTYLMNISGDFSENLKKSRKNMDSLSFLDVTTLDFTDVSWFSDFSDLKMLRFGNYAKSGDDNIDHIDWLLDGLKGCKSLKYFCANTIRDKISVDLSPLTDIDNLQYVSLGGAVSKFYGIEELIAKKNLRSLVAGDYDRSNDNDIKWMELGVKNENLGRLLVEGMVGSVIMHTHLGVYRSRLGEAWFRDFIKERRTAYEKCFKSHLLCNGYDELLNTFGSIEEIEAFTN